MPVTDPDTGQVIGIATRTDLLKTSPAAAPGRQNLAEKLDAALPSARLALLKAVAARATDQHVAVYVVGGFVRDRLRFLGCFLKRIAPGRQFRQLLVRGGLDGSGFGDARARFGDGRTVSAQEAVARGMADKVLAAVDVVQLAALRLLGRDRARAQAEALRLRAL